MDDIEIEQELNDAISISGHGEKRVRERLGLPKKAVAAEIRRALERGKSRTAISGRLRRHLDWLHATHGRYGDYRVWRGWVFVFKNQRFVTVLPMTDRLHTSKAAFQSSPPQKKG